MNKINSGRGGARKGAGRPPVPLGQEKKESWTVRVYEHEKPLVKSYLKSIRTKEFVKENDK